MYLYKDLIRNRINDLQKSLDDSKKNADELNDLMKKASSDLKNVSIGKIAVLVFACNRPSAIDKHLKQLFERRKTSNKIEKFPIIVSQDCGHLETAQWSFYPLEWLDHRTCRTLIDPSRPP